jgi:AAA+ superfamily predicted ATPase
MDFLTKLKNYHEASYPGLFVLTHEEHRFTKELRSLVAGDEPISIHEWDCQNGLVFKASNIPGHKIQHSVEKTKTSTDLLLYLQDYEERYLPDGGDDYESCACIFVLKDFHLHFDKVLNIRILRNAWNALKSRRNMLVFLGHKFLLPGELQKEVQLLDYSLPTEKDINDRLLFVLDSVNKELEGQKRPQLELSASVLEAATEAAKGMTYFEVENAFSLALIAAKKFDNKFVEAVFQEKIAQLKKNGLLTYMEPNVSFDNVGGMQGLKKWLTARKKAYSKDAREYNLPMPKGMLLASVPGTGKSLICKAIAKEFDCPLFALDIGSIFDSLVGNSEKNMREMIKTVESIGKCVILIDEIEKSLSNSAVGGTGDSGVSSRIFGTFLTWLNDRKNPAFIVATTNDHTKLPAALIRKGRFDQLFWVDLPTSEERKEIFSVVISKYKRDPKNFSLSSLVNGSKDFTGAEIEEVFKDAMYKAFELGQEVGDAHVLEVLSEFIPFAVSHADDLKAMRKQAQGKLVMVTSKGDPIADVQKNMRKLSIAIGKDEE